MPVRGLTGFPHLMKATVDFVVDTSQRFYFKFPIYEEMCIEFSMELRENMIRLAWYYLDRPGV